MPKLRGMQIFSVRVAWWSTGALIAILLWDLSGLDLPLAMQAGGPDGFALRHHWLLTYVLHSAAKYLAWLFLVCLCIFAAWPVGPLRQLAVSRRVQLAVSALLACTLISLLKAFSQTSCPWDLNEFGGVARHVSHWTGWRTPDGGAGRCFPAGHATTGFAFLGGFFALRHELPPLAKAWLVGALAAGLILGWAQQLRGAHFMSHTLWTAWLCWIVGWLVDPLFGRADNLLATGVSS